MDLNKNQRAIFEHMIDDPDLSRVIKKDVDLDTQPITEKEKLFVMMTIHHLHSGFEAQRLKQLSPLMGLEKDVRDYFSFPIPGEVWREVKKYQNKEFVGFVESQM